MPFVSRFKHFLRDFRKLFFCNKNSVDIAQYKYFIFIDSKVKNIIEQIYPYFYHGFFNKDKVIVIYRYHFENSKDMKKAFKKFGLESYCFINLRDIPSIKNAIWFYTHNSMTNLAVINKNVYSKHIWMGHGDSEKVSSYKKIIRIYDHCLVSGDRAVERFYQYGIFRKEEAYRFLHVGKVVLCSVLPKSTTKVGAKAILFAPTWEGPMREESYSTFHLAKENLNFIETVSQQLDLDAIIVKLHPNTGIRDAKTIGNTIETIELMLDLNKKIIFVAEMDSWVYSFIYKNFKERLEYRNSLYEISDYQLVVGVTNISAMASMIASEGIKTFALYDGMIKEQEKVNLLSVEKVNLRKSLKEVYNFDYKVNKKLISYEKGWNTLSQEEIFNEVEKLVKENSYVK